MDLVSHNPILQHDEHQPYEQHDADYDETNDMAESSTQNVDDFNTIYDNWAAPNTALKTDHQPQSAETAEDMLDTQELNSKIENEHESQPHITQLTDDDQINDHHIREEDSKGQINEQDTGNWLQHSTRQWQPNIQYADYIHGCATDPEQNGTADPENQHQMSKEIVARTWEYLMTQHNVNQGQKLYRKQREEAMQKELQQLHDVETFEQVDPKILIYKEKKRQSHLSCF